MTLRTRLKQLSMLIPGYRELVTIKDQLRGIRRELEQIRSMTAVQIQDFEAMRSERYSDPLRLHRYAVGVNSQYGEDGMIQEIFRRIDTTNRVFVEIGVGDGIENNTAFLLAMGWSGVWIDSDGAFRSRIPNDRAARLKTHVGFVTAENVAELLVSMGVSAEFDLLSLDIDQNTFHVWDAIDNIRPRVVISEYNATIPPSVDWCVEYSAVRSWDGSINFGASLAAFERLGREKGYSLVGCDFHGANAFFVRDDLVGSRFCEPFTAINHYEPPRYFITGRRGHFRALLDRQVPDSSSE